MLTRILAAGALVAMTATAAHAGTLTNGAWTPTGCAEPGPVPEMNGKTGDAYNKSAKAYQAWADKAQPYEKCVQEQAKADQSAVVEGANKVLSALNDASTKFQADANAAMEALKKKH